MLDSLTPETLAALVARAEAEHCTPDQLLQNLLWSPAKPRPIAGMDPADVLERISDAFLALDRNWRFVYMNQSARQRIQRDDLIGKVVWDEFPELIGSVFERHFLGSAASGRESTLVEYYPPLNSWVEIHTYPTSDGLCIYFRDITQQKQAERELRESQDLYRAILESQLDIICRYRLDSTLVYVNDAYCQRFNRTREELIGHSYLPFSDPAAHDQIRARLAELERDPSPGVSEIRGIAADGKEYWIEWVDHGITDETGKVVFIQAVGRDITRLKQVEAAILEHEERYRMLFDRNPLPLWVYDAETLGFLAVNEAAVQHYGYSEAEFLKMTIKDIRPPEDIPRLLEYLRQYKSHENQRTLWKHRKKDGTLIDVEVITHEVTFAERPARLVLVNDITERERAATELRASEDRFRSMFEATSDGMILMDLKGNMLLVNRGLEMMSGYPREELLNKSVLMLIAREERRKFVQSARLYLGQVQHQVISAEQGLVAIRKDQRRFPVEVTVTPVPIGDQTLIMCLIVDLTDRMLLESQRLYARSLELELESEREMIEIKERFISTVSHEFRTPLSVIMSSVGILLRYLGKLPQERISEKLQAIANQVQRMVSLMDDVLTLSRGNANRIAFQPEPVDLRLFCQDMIDNQRLVDVQGHEFVLETSETLGVRQADWRLLEHIFVNLLSNAVKYSPPHSRIVLRVEDQEERVIFAVEDQGIGIPESDQPHVFQPFHRAENVSSVQGTGLGLAITRQSVQAHGGTIAFTSRVGEGTTFLISLPLKR